MSEQLCGRTSATQKSTMRRMDDLSQRIRKVILQQELRAELLAGVVRLVALLIFARATLLDMRTLSSAANEINFGALLIDGMHEIWSSGKHGGGSIILR